MAAVNTAKSGAGHCWELVLIVVPPWAPFGAEIQRTSRFYGMDRPIWDILNAPGGAPVAVRLMHHFGSVDHQS